jgi:hypothetical protein
MTPIGDEKPLEKATETAIRESFIAIRDFLGTIGGPAATEFGGTLGDWMKYWRFKNMVNIALRAKSFLERRGIQPKRVLPGTMIPLLEAASLADTEELQEMWASLLASAARGDAPEVPPAYVFILRELSPVEARVLALAAARPETSKFPGSERRLVHWVLENEIICEFGLPLESVRIMEANLVRLGLWASTVENIFAELDPLSTPEMRVVYEDAAGEPLGGLVQRKIFELTPLGIDLIQRCQGVT